MIRAVAPAVAAVSAVAMNAQIATEFSSEMVLNLLQNGGDYTLPNGDHCCSMSSPDCQIQLQSQGSRFFQSASRNATTSVAGAGSDPYAIVTLYNLNQEIAVNATFGCESWCKLDAAPSRDPCLRFPRCSLAFDHFIPLSLINSFFSRRSTGPTDGDTFEPVTVQGWQDQGPANIFVPLTGKTVAAENYFSQDQVFNITMDYSNLYVDQTTNGPSNAIPVLQIEVLTPFGSYAATANTTYAAFTPGPVDSKWFAVVGLNGCQQDSAKNCGDDSSRLAHRRNVAAAKATQQKLVRRLVAAKAEEKKALEALSLLQAKA